MFFCQIKNKRVFQTVLLAAVCIMINFGLALIMLYPGHDWGGDFSQYIAQTRALVNGEIDNWYEKNLFIIENSCDGLGSTVYPWGFSLLLAPFYTIFGENILVFKFLIILFMSGTVAVAFAFYRRKMPNLPATLLTLLIAINPVYLIGTDSVESDIPCMFFSMLTVLCIDMHLKSDKHHLLNALFSGLFVFCSIQIRTMALALLLALFCVDVFLAIYWLIFKKRELDIWGLGEYYQSRWYYHLIPYGVYGVGEFVMCLLLPKAGETYWDYFTISFANVKTMLEYYYFGFQEMFGAMVWVFLFFGFIGIIGFFREEIYCAIYVMGTITMLLIYNYYQRSRFLFTVFPLLILFSFYGVKFIYSLLPKKVICIAATFSVCVALGLYIKQLIVEEIPIRIGIVEPIDAYSADAQSTYDYININIEDDSIIYFFKPRVLYLNTNVYSYTGDNDVSMLGLADYILFWCNDFQDDIKKAVVSNESYRLIYQNNQFSLYECK